MIEVASYFQSENLGSLLEGLQELPDEIRPLYFSDSENLAGTENLLSDRKRFEQFIDRNPDGFFLHGNACLYDFKLYLNQPSQIYIDLPEEQQSSIDQIFLLLLRSDPEFGYAADNEERNHRNRCYKTIGANHIEDWVGRDIGKYVPGLYFYTLLSKSLVEKHGINLPVLKSAAVSCDDLGSSGRHYLLKFYNDSTEWRSEAEKLDELCYRVEGIFSLREVERSIKDIDNLMDYDDVIYNWR